MRKISVVVPIYKVEKYLNKCVDSIINQTYTNIEIILVDDGSPDKCGEICDEYARKDNRVKVIHKKNGGLSDARNAGMKIATGDYLFFVDSDDFITKDALEYLMSFVTNDDISIVIGGVEDFDDKTGAVIKSTANGDVTVKTMNNNEAIKDVLTGTWAAWGRLYKREVHEGIEFPFGEINEDEAIVFRVLHRSKVVIKTSRVVYKYRYRANSITSQSFNREKVIAFNHYVDNCKYIEENYPEFLLLAQNRMHGMTCYLLCCMAINPEQFKSEIKELRSKLKEKYNVFIKPSYFENKSSFRGWLLTYAFYPYSFLIRLLGKKYV